MPECVHEEFPILCILRNRFRCEVVVTVFVLHVRDLHWSKGGCVGSDSVANEKVLEPLVACSDNAPCDFPNRMTDMRSGL